MQRLLHRNDRRVVTVSLNGGVHNVSVCSHIEINGQLMSMNHLKKYIYAMAI